MEHLVSWLALCPASTHTQADVDMYTHSSCLLNLGIWTSVSSYG